MSIAEKIGLGLAVGLLALEAGCSDDTTSVREPLNNQCSDPGNPNWIYGPQPRRDKEYVIGNLPEGVTLIQDSQGNWLGYNDLPLGYRGPVGALQLGSGAKVLGVYIDPNSSDGINDSQACQRQEIARALSVLQGHMNNPDRYTVEMFEQ